MEGLAVLIVVVVVVMAIFADRWIKEEESRRLSELRCSLDDGQGQTEHRWPEGLAGMWVSGKLGGALVSLSFEKRGSGKHAYHVARYSVEVDNPAGDFELGRTSVWEDLGIAFGVVERPAVVSGVRDLVVREGATDAVRGLFQRDAVANAVRALQARGFDALKLRSGTLVAERHYDRRSLDLDHVRGVFTCLVDLGRALSRREVTITLKDAAPRFAWTDGGAASLCPYCRDQVAAEGDEVAACEACGTLHHRACLDEAGGCTIFGCGRAGTRGRVR